MTYESIMKKRNMEEAAFNTLPTFFYVAEKSPRRAMVLKLTGKARHGDDPFTVGRAEIVFEGKWVDCERFARMQSAKELEK